MTRRSSRPMLLAIMVVALTLCTGAMLFVAKPAPLLADHPIAMQVEPTQGSDHLSLDSTDVSAVLYSGLLLLLLFFPTKQKRGRWV